MNLRFQVADALRSLGTGFLCHPANAGLRAQLQDPDTSSQTRQAFFEQLLSLVYRFIFLATVEDRSDAATGRYETDEAWLDRVRQQPGSTSRQAVIAKALYSVSSYKNWADKARGATENRFD